MQARSRGELPPRAAKKALVQEALRKTSGDGGSSKDAEKESSSSEDAEKEESSLSKDADQ